MLTRCGRIQCLDVVRVRSPFPWWLWATGHCSELLEAACTPWYVAALSLQSWRWCTEHLSCLWSLGLPLSSCNSVRPIRIISLSYLQLTWELNHLHRSLFATRIIFHHFRLFLAFLISLSLWVNFRISIWISVKSMLGSWLKLCYVSLWVNLGKTDNLRLLRLLTNQHAMLFYLFWSSLFHQEVLRFWVYMFCKPLVNLSPSIF